jgi:hypothetical protein
MAVSQAGSCSCKSEVVVVVEVGTGPINVKADTEDAATDVAGWRLVVAQAEVGSVVSAQSQDCRAEEVHRKAGKEECSGRMEQAIVACSAAAKGQEWVAWAQAQAGCRPDCSTPVLPFAIVSLFSVAFGFL